MLVLRQFRHSIVICCILQNNRTGATNSKLPDGDLVCPDSPASLLSNSEMAGLHAISRVPDPNFWSRSGNPRSERQLKEARVRLSSTVPREDLFLTANEIGIHRGKSTELYKAFFKRM